MQKEAIQAIVSSAKSAGLEDYLVVVDDNARRYRVKSQTSTAYFDDGKEVLYCFSFNDNPIRNTMTEPQFIIEACTYDHITSITVQVPDDQLKDVLSSYSFDEEETKRIIKTVGKNFQATGYQYNKKNEDPIKKAPYMSGIEMGLPYTPYTPPTSNDEETEEGEG